MEGGALCKHCGAVLPMPDAEGRISCLSCGRSGKAKAQPARPEPTVTGTPGSAEPLFTTWTPGPGERAARPSRTGRSIGCLVSVAVFAVIGAVGAAALSAIGSTSEDDASSASTGSGGSLTVAGSEVVFATTDGTEIVSAVYDGRADVRSLARLRLGSEGDAGEVWRSEAFPPGVYGGPLAIVADTVFTALGDELWAVDVETGETRWEASLPDAVHGSCECFLVHGDTLVVQTADAQVFAYRAGSAEALWGHRLSSASGEVLLSGAGLVVIDDSTDSPGAREVRVMDPSTGSRVSSFAPVCQDDAGSTREMSFTDEVFAMPDSTDLVATVSFGGGCAVRWNGATGEVVWTAATGDLSASGFDVGEIVGDRIALSTSSGLAIVDSASGATVVAAAPADNRLSPEVRVGDVLLARSQTTRGSTRYGLVGIDVTTGEVRWQEPLPGGGALAEAGDTSGALFSGTQISHLARFDDGLRLITFEADGETTKMSMAPLDPTTGSLGERATIDFDTGSGTPSVGVLATNGSGVLLSIDGDVVLVTADGQTTAYPG